MRVGLYYAPRLDDPLWEAAITWLGRCPASGVSPKQPDLPDISAVTAEARRYGFHATLKPPMHLRPGVSYADVRDAAAVALARVPAFDLPPLAIADLHGFLALRETAETPALQALADACVAELDEFRAPPDDAELARRRKSGLSPAREAMLTRWGYPDVFATWQFHMTLTRRLDPREKSVYAPAAEAHFGAALGQPRRVEDVTLFIEDSKGAPFRLVDRIPLGAGQHEANG